MVGRALEGSWEAERMPSGCGDAEDMSECWGRCKDDRRLRGYWATERMPSIVSEIVLCG